VRSFGLNLGSNSRLAIRPASRIVGVGVAITSILPGA
jgi:hypothetical protein